MIMIKTNKMKSPNNAVIMSFLPFQVLTVRHNIPEGLQNAERTLQDAQCLTDNRYQITF